MIGKTTFNLNKGEYSETIGRIINNHRVNSKVIGLPKDFILRSCRLSTNWAKLANNPDVSVHIRNVDIAGGRKVRMVCLELNGTRQPIPKAKLVDSLYPPRKTKSSATPEEKHHGMVKAAMRRAVENQLKDFRSSVSYPLNCYLTGKKLLKGVLTDVDHVEMSFSEIADSFIRVKGLRYSDVILVGFPTGKKFKDTSLWDDWSEYHQSCAKYALVCPSANRSKGCGDYVTPPDLVGSFKAEDPEDLSIDF
jgi:hypothetical protein